MEAGTGLGEGRDQHAAGVVTGTDHAQQRLTGGHRFGGCGQLNHTLLGIRCFGIAQEDAERWLGAAEQFVGLRCLLDREAMGDQRLGAQATGGQDVKDGLEVALLSPAHKANRVVAALLLIGSEITRQTLRQVRGRVLVQALSLWLLVVPLTLVLVVYLVD